MTDSKSSKIDLARLADLADGPAARLARTLEDSPTQRLIRATEDTQRLIRALESDTTIHFSRQIEEVARSARLLELERPAIVAFLSNAEAIQRTLQSSALVDGLARLQQQHSSMARALESAFLPTTTAISSLSAELARAVEPYRSALSSLSAWETSLATRMKSLETAWALPDCLGESMIGFARLSRLSDAAHTAEPYAAPVGELLADELGAGVQFDTGDAPIARDAAAVDAGLNPELIAFPPGAYGQVVLAAGFEFRIAGPPVPQAVEAVHPGAVFDPTHGFLLTEIEQRLRQLVEERLQALAGKKWVRQRVSESVRKRWMDRQAEEQAVGRPVYALIQYSDFMDLADVICQSNNWRDAFGPIFRSKEDFAVSLRRLHPVRKAIAHGRPLGRADVLTLVSEATRVLGALGVRLLG